MLLMSHCRASRQGSAKAVRGGDLDNSVSVKAELMDVTVFSRSWLLAGGLVCLLAFIGVVIAVVVTTTRRS